MSEIILSWWQLHIHRFTIALFDYTASYQIRVSEWIYTLIVAWISKPLAQNRCDIWSLNANTRPFSQTEPTIELCWKGWFVWCIWLYVLVISRSRFRVNTVQTFYFYSYFYLFKNDLIDLRAPRGWSWHFIKKINCFA